jgi:hypothetical protein
MGEARILHLLQEMAEQVERLEVAVSQNSLTEVEKRSTAIHELNEKLHRGGGDIAGLLSKNTDFQAKYEERKRLLNEAIVRVRGAIEHWQTGQLQKIADSKNVIDNIAHYLKAKMPAYFIDRTE